MKTAFTIFLFWLWMLVVYFVLSYASPAKAGPYVELEASLSDRYGTDPDIALNNVYGAVEAGYAFQPMGSTSVSLFARHNGLVAGDWYGPDDSFSELGVSARWEFWE